MAQGTQASPAQPQRTFCISAVPCRIALRVTAVSNWVIDSALRCPERTPLSAQGPQPARWADLDDQDVPREEAPAALFAVRLLGVLAVLASFCYLIWRVVATVPGASWWLAWPLLVLELHAVLAFVLYVHVLWHPGSVPQPEPVLATRRSVAVLIATYDEPPEILLPTVAAAGALPQARSVWVLDDGGRAWVEEMCGVLGAEYRARATHEHAQAGNINAVLSELDCELIAILDADHVVRSDFLANLLGYFDDPDVALVQTPQTFYNTDSFEHTGSFAGRRHCEQDRFDRLLAESRNRWDAALWCGTNSVLRLEVLKEVGGVATATVTPDIDTTIHIHRAGYRTVYHNEVLARGQAANTSEQYLNQRLRWGTGAMQVLRANNPTTESSFTWHQRLSYASTLFGWFDAWRTLGLIVLPMATLLTGGLAAAAPATTFLTLFGLFWLVQHVGTQVLARGRAPLWPARLFELIRLPASLKATTALVGARPRPFTVADRGRTGARRRRMPIPRLLVILLAGCGVSALWYVGSLTGRTPVSYPVPWVAHASAIWLAYNAAFLGAALHRIRSPKFATERRAAARFPASGRILVDDVAAQVRNLSLTGGQLTTTVDLQPGSKVRLDLDPMMSGPVEAWVRSSHPVEQGHRIGVEFSTLTTGQRARLARGLFQTGLTPMLAPVAATASGDEPRHHRGRSAGVRPPRALQVAPLRHVVRGDHLDKEVSRRRRHIGKVLAAGIAKHLEQDVMVRPRQIEDAEPVDHGGAAQPVTAVQRGLVASRQVTQEGGSVVAGEIV